jgi:hypothetical protein
MGAYTVHTYQYVTFKVNVTGLMMALRKPKHVTCKGAGTP